MTNEQNLPKLWHSYSSYGSYGTLTGDIRCDIAVVGGGMTGVCLAYILGERGFKVALFEENTLASGKTGRSTAKATVAHELAYSTLAEKISTEASRKYAEANLAGLDFLKKHVSSGKSEQAVVRRDHYLYALYGEKRLRKEYLVMRENGINCEYYTKDSVPLPFKTEAAIKIPDQVQLDPVRFVHELCENGKFRVFEHSRAEMISKNILRCGGHTVTADKLVFAVNYPTKIPGLYAPLKLSRKTSCAAVFVCDEGFTFPEVMAYGVDGGYGYRYTPDHSLLVSGETHRGAPAPNAIERMVTTVRSFAPTAQLREAWTNNDTYTHDGIPYVGEVGGVYIACGYSAWGMTNSVGAAVLLAEKIAGGEVWYGDIFAPERNFMRGGSSEFSEHLTTAVGGMVKDFTNPPEITAKELDSGYGAIINYRGKRVGAYRDKEGELHFVSLRCPHMGCELEWNQVEQTWDCPCHGSRFNGAGECISNPAEHGIGILR